ncbi:hypothetical protein IB227_15420 [Stenotrophomonas sp. STM01]|uniref:hypothetical protein n=1 Tax=Stenotrophomonas sp. STM01 TaxID=2769278 RepID=UPI0017873432|nr:hypothetical protein [Stenotrophomonas sp. STM01]MBD9537242.1 hypothetical protein [Stenotrophomonas sp. STM01]
MEQLLHGRFSPEDKWRLQQKTATKNRLGVVWLRWNTSLPEAGCKKPPEGGFLRIPAALRRPVLA